MAWDVQNFLLDHGIPHDHQRLGWLNIQCPACGDTGMHGGLNVVDGYYHCWRCGSKPLKQLVGMLLNLRYSEAEAVYQKYERYTNVASLVRKKQNSKSFSLFGDPLGKFHRAYLDGRGFDPDHIAKVYGVLGTGPGQKRFGMDWSARLIIPLHDGAGRVIGCQGRDITGKHKLRYVGTPLEESLMDYKDTLYAAHLATGPQVFVVEGVMDAWRLGPGFVASYGTAMSKAQILMLARRWSSVGFIFDPEPTAQAKAREFASQLAGLGVSAELIQLDSGGRDPGDLTPTEAREVRIGLGLR